MQKGLIAIGFLVVIATLVSLAYFDALIQNPVILCLLAWSVLWLGIWQAKRLHVTVGHGKQAKAASDGFRFWLIRFATLALTLVLGLGAYTQYLVHQYSLPTVYQWQAMAWVLGVNRPLPTLVTIPAGRFEMGSDRNEREQPIHQVIISEPFEMGEHEVTFTQYDYFIWQRKQAGLTDIDYPKDQGWGRNEHPVINVDWAASYAYIHWLNQNMQQGLRCRLPSEAEWEYAARARTPTPFYWGDKDPREYANYGKEKCCEGVAKGNDQWVNTAPVKQFKPNDFGLYDMSGNVYEWTQDKWHDTYQDAPDNGSAWESGDSPFRVLRGGSWDDASGGVRSANRFFNGFGLSNIGFRIVCSPIDH